MRLLSATSRHRFLIAAAATVIVALVACSAASAATPQLVGGTFHVCALKYDGTVWCFGSNTSGELGNTVNNGTQVPNPTPTLVSQLGTSTVALAAGGSTTCALGSDAKVRCFGGNNFGQLGFTDNLISNPNPTETLPMGAAPISIGAGGATTCAILADGTVKCFGRNQEGQLGNSVNSGALNPTPTPTATGALGSGATQLATSGFHTCVLLANTAVKCFGYNYHGELGTSANNGTSTPNPTPASTDPLGAPAKAIAAAGNHTCALLVDGIVKCFGENGSGQLGKLANVGTGNPNPVPAATLPLGRPAAAIAPGGTHTCALLDDGTVTCFGMNRNGQLGNSVNSGSTVPNPTPTPTIPLGAPAIALASSFRSTCALLNDGGVSCWGDNVFGELGSSVAGYSYLPARVEGLKLFAPPSPTPSIFSGKFAKPKFKSRLRKGRISVTGNVRVGAPGLSPAACTGKIKVVASLKVKKKTKRLASKSFPVKFVGASCSASVILKIKKAYKGKKPTFTLTLAGGPLLTAKPLKFKQKI